MITFEQTPFAEVKLFCFDGVTDNRGFKIRNWSREDFLQHGIDFAPVESVIYEIPEAGTLYGIHFQLEPKPQQKLITLIAGAGIDYAIDLRPDSPTFKKWFSVELAATNHRQILIPRGFGHLFYSTEPDTKMLFQIDREFDTALSKTISYRDPEIALDICNRDFIVSPKDAAAPLLNSIQLNMDKTKNNACQILGMHHISMKCKDKVLFEKAVAFYKDILGFCEERRWAEGVMLQEDSARLEIFCNGEGIREQGAIRHFALETKNVDELAAKVKTAGYEVFIEPKNITIESEPQFHARMAFFYGPLGEQVELFNPELVAAPQDETPPTKSDPQIQVLRASEEWQRAGAYSVRIEGMNRQHHIPLRDEFDEHDCDGTKYIVLLDDGYPVATCRFYENDTRTVTLGRVVVLPEYRGLGLGKKVVTEAEAWAKELGYKKINIDSRVEAIQFYEKLGYLHATGNDEIIKSGSFECVQMYKEL